MAKLLIKRVPYGKPSTPANRREYQLPSGGPVGFKKDWEKFAKQHGYQGVRINKTKRR